MNTSSLFNSALNFKKEALRKSVVEQLVSEGAVIMVLKENLKTLI